MKHQFYMKCYITWRSAGETWYDTCHYCGAGNVVCGFVITEFDEGLSMICKNCSDKLPQPKIKSLRDFWKKMREEDKPK